jgi:hypothetical protein
LASRVHNQEITIINNWNKVYKANSHRKELQMEIFNMIRGHFALLINKPLTTPAQGKEFHIESVSTKEGDWQIVLNISTGKQAKVYISDILRVYTYVVSSNRPLTQAEIDVFVGNECLSKAITSYVIPLIATFSDIEVSQDPKWSIRFIPLKEAY